MTRLQLVSLAGVLSLLWTALVLAADAPATTQPTTTTAPAQSAAAKALKANLDRFCLDLDYRGGSDKPFYALALCVSKDDFRKGDSFHLSAQITPETAGKIIDQLTQAGFFEKAHDMHNGEDATPTGYALTLRDGPDASGVYLRENLFLNLKTFERLDELNALLDGDAKTAMEQLLSRIGGIRNQLKAKAPPATTNPTTQPTRE